MKLSTDFSLSRFVDTEKLSAYYQLTKPGITFTVLGSMLVGFILGSGNEVNYLLMLHAIVGTWLIAAGTAAHNQFMEWRHDSKMKRTRKRPLPSSRITPAQGARFSISLILGGLLYLVLMVNHIAALISITTTILYLGAYTPMKRISAANVFIGAIPGALPPVGGWAAAAGNLGSIGMWLLFAIVFLWQVPHVMAIAWVCKDDYRNAGFRMLPKNDESGHKTTVLILGCLIAILPVTWGIYAVEMSSWIYLAGAMICALVFLYYGIIFAIKRSKESARKLMFSSFGYLPLVWIFIFLDKLILT